MPYWCWLLLANGGIFWLERVYRIGQYGSFWQALPFIILPILLGQLGLYNGFHTAPSIFVAGIMFTVVNQVLRIVNALILGETVTIYQVVGITLTIIASYVVKLK